MRHRKSNEVEREIMLGILFEISFFKVLAPLAIFPASAFGPIGILEVALLALAG